MSSDIVLADDDSIIDQVSIAVPVACTMSGTGMDSHNANISNGTYSSTIGETIIKALCNDNEGFAIYAIGYSNNENGKNVLTNATLGSTFDIATGTGTSGTDSQWAMKLSTVVSPAPTYPITIQNSFDSFHNVPSDYTLAAKRTSATDVGANAEGSILKTTYQAYISPTQAAGVYTGQVKYSLLHPSSVDKKTMSEAITVVFDGNGLTFPDGSMTNTVKYAMVRDQGIYAYVSNTRGAISKTPNIDNNGNQNAPIVTNDTYSDMVTISGADKLKIVLRYDIDPSGIDESNANAGINLYDNYNLYSDYYGSGVETIMAEGDTVNFNYESWGDIDEDHDYGYYAEIYAVYDNEQPSTTGETLPSNTFTFKPISGAYMETTEWHDKWTATIDGYDREFEEALDCEADWCVIDNSARGSLLNYLNTSYDYLKGTTLTLQSFNPVTFDEVYAAANKTRINGYYKMQDLDASMCASVTQDELTTVIDIRDNKTYDIGKLRNGWCWMSDDLELDPTNSTTASNLSASNTNASDEAIYNLLHGGNLDGNNGWTSAAVVEDNTNNSYIEPKIDKSIHYNIAGISYNFCAISAGTYCYTENDDPLDSSTYDLCPKNWSLPPYSNEVSGYGKAVSIQTGSEKYWSNKKSLSAFMGAYQYEYSWYGITFVNYKQGIRGAIRNGYYRARCIIDASN